MRNLMIGLCALALVACHPDKPTEPCDPQTPYSLAVLDSIPDHVYGASFGTRVGQFDSAGVLLSCSVTPVVLDGAYFNFSNGAAVPHGAVLPVNGVASFPALRDSVDGWAVERLTVLRIRFTANGLSAVSNYYTITATPVAGGQ